MVVLHEMQFDAGLRKALGIVGLHEETACIAMPLWHDFKHAFDVEGPDLQPLALRQISDAPAQIGGIFILSQPRGALQHLVRRQPALLEGDLLGTSDLDALPMFDRAHEGRCVVQAVMGPGVEPGKAAPQSVHMQQAALEIGVVDRRDLEFAARRRLESTQRCRRRCCRKNTAR